METCLSGFSFVPENNVEVMKLQYVEGGELSQAWRKSRRQRMKDLEAKIWEQFLKEQDIVRSVCDEDPYQFLEHLPEDCLNELMEVEFNKIREGHPGKSEEQAQTVAPQVPEKQFVDTFEPRETMVTFADDDSEPCEMIHIFDDEKDDVSGPEIEDTADSASPPATVRANRSPSPGGSLHSPDNKDISTSEKQSESVRNMIETSMNKAKVKEFQSKVNLELLAVITTLEAQDFDKIDPRELPKYQRQCAEFCARYGRIYLYQLKRQIQDITRYNNSALPFARHTFLRSQMIRAVSLQQNMLQALQALHKWITQKPPLKECVDALKSYASIVKEGDLVCPIELHNDELQQTCHNLDGALAAYSQKLSQFLDTESACSSRSRKTSRKPPPKKKSLSKWPKQSKPNSEADARLFMYSLDSLRVRTRPSATNSKETPSSVSTKVVQSASSVKAPEPDVSSKKKSPRSRRPLMRAPGVQRPREKPREPDNIPTMVESVGMCNSSHISREASPRVSPVASLPRSKNATPRGIRKLKKLSPHRRGSPRRTPPSPPPISDDDLKLDLNAVKAEPEATLSPVIKVQCEKKELKPEPEEPKESPKKKEKRKDIDASCEVSRLLRRLCAAGGSPGGKSDRASGAKNAQLLCVNGSSPRQPSTPQLLRILEETIQKKAPKPQFSTNPKVKDVNRFRLAFNVSPRTAESLFQYRTKFVQHMLASPMYANSVVGKPWEMIGSVSEQIIDEILLACAKEMQLEGFLEELYKSETK